MKRFENEDFEEYRERRKQDKEDTKQKLKGKLVWDSKNKGIYKR